MANIFRQIGEYLSEYGLKILLAVCIFIIGCCLAWLIGFLLKKIIAKTHLDGATITFIVSVLRIIIIVSSVLLVASVLELSTEGLVVSLSTVALAVGLALKDSFSNLANGILILYNKPFRRGDFVSIDGVEGKIHNVKLMTIELITPNNVKIILPNSKVLKGTVLNYSALGIRRIDMKFTVSHDNDMDKVEAILRRIAENHPKVLKSMNISVFMSSIEHESIVYSVKVWANNADYFTVSRSFSRLVFDEFKKEGIMIPHNQLFVKGNHITQ